MNSFGGRYFLSVRVPVCYALITYVRGKFIVSNPERYNILCVHFQVDFSHDFVHTTVLVISRNIVYTPLTVLIN